MSNKEKAIIRNLGYSPFVLYQYIKHTAEFSNKDVEFELGMSECTRKRTLQVLKKHNIIKNTGKHGYSRSFSIIAESDWSI